MQFAVTPLHVRGVALYARARREAVPVAGDLRVEYWTEEMRRTVRVARLIDSRFPLRPDRLPPLREVHLGSMSSGCFTLTGLERLEEGGVRRDYAQVWLVGPVGVTRTSG